jgi:hypothetical protein
MSPLISLALPSMKVITVEWRLVLGRREVDYNFWVVVCESTVRDLVLLAWLLNSPEGRSKAISYWRKQYQLQIKI